MHFQKKMIDQRAADAATVEHIVAQARAIDSDIDVTLPNMFSPNDMGSNSADLMLLGLVRERLGDDAADQQKVAQEVFRLKTAYFHDRIVDSNPEAMKHMVQQIESSPMMGQVKEMFESIQKEMTTVQEISKALSEEDEAEKDRLMKELAEKELTKLGQPITDEAVEAKALQMRETVEQQQFLLNQLMLPVNAETAQEHTIEKIGGSTQIKPDYLPSREDLPSSRSIRRQNSIGDFRRQSLE